MQSILALLVVVLYIAAPTQCGLLYGPKYNGNAAVMYVAEKATVSCIGEEAMRTKTDFLKLHLTQCYMEEVTPKEVEKRDVSAQLQQENEQVKVSGPRTYDATTIRLLKHELLSTIRITGCLFDKFNMSVLANGSVKADDYKAFIFNLVQNDKELLGYIENEFDTCINTASDFTPSFYGVKHVEYEKLLNLFRCTELCILKGCMKRDLQHQQFDLNGLDGEFADLTEMARRELVYSAFANWDRTGLWDM